MSLKINIYLKTLYDEIFFFRTDLMEDIFRSIDSGHPWGVETGNQTIHKNHQGHLNSLKRILKPGRKYAWHHICLHQDGGKKPLVDSIRQNVKTEAK